MMSPTQLKVHGIKESAVIKYINGDETMLTVYRVINSKR